MRQVAFFNISLEPQLIKSPSLANWWILKRAIIFRNLLNNLEDLGYVPDPFQFSNPLQLLNPSSASVALICCANQLTGFYMRATLTFNGLTLTLTFSFLTFIFLSLTLNKTKTLFLLTKIWHNASLKECN